MTRALAVYLCLLLAFLMPSLPFVGGHRAVRSNSTARRIALWLMLYGVWIAATTVLEGSVSAQVSKDWSFWPISLVFFAVLAFPGVVYHCLWRP